MTFIQNAVTAINDSLSGYILIFLLVGIGLYFTFRTRFVQVRCFGEGLKNVFGGIKFRGGKKEGGLSSFQALATAVAAQVGTGNIVGACGAILIGGPGAIFWMWIIAFLGMATIYAEAVIAQKTRVVNPDGSVEGGPIYYIRTAFKGTFGKILAGFFAVAAIIALGFVGAMVQSNSIAENVSDAVYSIVNVNGNYATNPFVLAEFGPITINWISIIVGVLVAAFAGFVLLGGAKRLASVTEKIVPIMAIFYIVGGLVVLGINYKYILPAFGMIFKCAFRPDALIGGALGAAIVKAVQKGAQRGLFSNEAGMGSTPHAHALADVKKPHDQGTSAMIGVFIDTFIVLTITALVVISTLYCANNAPFNADSYRLFNELEAAKVADSQIQAFGMTNSTMAQAAFGNTFAVIFGQTAGAIIGKIFVAVCLLFFAFSTILSWNYFGKVNFTYLFGKKSAIAYSVIAIVFVFLGSIFKSGLVWDMTDMFNSLMVLPNVVALFALGGTVVALTKFGKNKKNKDDLE